MSETSSYCTQTHIILRPHFTKICSLHTVRSSHATLLLSVKCSKRRMWRYLSRLIALL